MFDISQSICNPSSSNGVLDYFLSLPQKGKVQAEYIWIGGSGRDIRSKTKTLEKQVRSLSDLPEWNFDGSSTGQAQGHDSEVWLIPVKYVPDPFRKSPNILVLCECFEAKTMKPLASNRRANARKIFENPKVAREETWWGIEQEYTMFEPDGKTPLGWPRAGFPLPQGPYYCSVGARRAVGRSIVEAHYRACLYAELDISGINAEVMLGQWEFQVGPCIGIDSGDQLWLSRYILERISEMFGVCVSFDAKPIKGDWNGAGAHTNYSTKSMRALDPTHVSVSQNGTLPKSIKSTIANTKKFINNTKEILSPKDSTTSKMNSFGRYVNESKTNEDGTRTPTTTSVTTTGGYGNNAASPPIGKSAKLGANLKLGPLLGYSAIIAAIEKLKLRHNEHMKVYGKDNKERLLGSHETARYDQFSYGVANRGASIRIPRMAEKEGCGYFEDRRPAANCDPYDVTSIIAETTILM